MLKRLVIVAGALVIVLAAVACGSDKEASTDNDQGDATPVATKAVATKAAATEVAPTEEATKEASGDGAGALESLSFLTSGMFGGEVEGSITGAADPDLTSLLLTGSDLPSSFNIVGGDMGFSMDMPEGTTRMAMRTFMEGDPNSTEMSPTVVSAVMAMPAAALADFDSQLTELDQMSAEDIEAAMGGSSMMGIEFKELNIQKISLGDGGISMRMVMDMSGLADAFGDLAEEGMGDFPTGFAFDTYLFKSGDNILMVMTMLAEGQESPVDAAALAEIMESKVQ